MENLNRKDKSLLKVLLKTKCFNNPAQLLEFFDLEELRGIHLLNVKISQLHYPIDEEIKICIANSHINYTLMSEWKTFLLDIFDENEIIKAYKSLADGLSNSYAYIDQLLSSYRIIPTEYRCDILSKKLNNLLITKNQDSGILTEIENIKLALYKCNKKYECNAYS